MALVSYDLYHKCSSGDLCKQENNEAQIERTAGRRSFSCTGKFYLPVQENERLPSNSIFRARTLALQQDVVWGMEAKLVRIMFGY